MRVYALNMAKNKNSNQSTEIGALLEHIDDKVTLIAEQHGDIRAQNKSLNKKFEGLNSKVDNISDTVGSIKEDVEVLKEDVSIIKTDIEFIKHDLKSKINRDEFAVLERRVALLESRR